MLSLLRRKGAGFVDEIQRHKSKEPSRGHVSGHISDITLANKVVDGKTVRESLTDIIHSLEKNPACRHDHVCEVGGEVLRRWRAHREPQ